MSSMVEGDPGEMERKILEEIVVEDTQAEQALARAQYEELQAQQELEDEFAWHSKEDAEIAEAEAKDAASASEASTQKLTAEDQQRWEDWALASELGVASPPKRQRVLVHVPAAGPSLGGTMVELGEVPAGQTVWLTLRMEADTNAGEVSTRTPTELVRLQGVQLVPFLESNPGATIFRWWREGLIPSVLIRQELGADVLEAFQAQRSFLDSQAVERLTGK